MQQIQLDSGESFDYKKGYDFSINEVHKIYNLRSNKNTEPSSKKSSQTENKKIVEAPTTKVPQILPRENRKNSSSSQKVSSPKISPSPNIVDITYEFDQATKDSQKSSAAKAPDSAKTTNLDPKTPNVDPKSVDPKAVSIT